jgi:hypothetical protein
LLLWLLWDHTSGKRRPLWQVSLIVRNLAERQQGGGKKGLLCNILAAVVSSLALTVSEMAIITYQLELILSFTTFSFFWGGNSSH